MSGGTATGRKDFLIKKEKVDLDAEISGKNDPILASFMSESRKLGGGQANDMSQTICMFRKYLLSKSQSSTGKTNMEESEVLKTRCPRPLRPPKFGCNMPRQASFLEQELLPGIRNEPVQSSPSNGKSPASQLTIFYEGAINVYDNVPLDKAQAIMLLAGESSLPRPVALELPKSEMRKPVIQSRSSTTLTANSKSEADLPIARKISLQHFLEKRRRRITSKAPYNSPAKTENNEETDEESRKDRGLIKIEWSEPEHFSFTFPFAFGLLLCRIHQTSIRLLKIPNKMKISQAQWKGDLRK